MGSIPRDESLETQVDLTIIGGGPTGLLTGYLAEQLGVSVCIIDSKQGPLELGRADALNARTQQSLEVVGILDDLIQQGITCNTSSTFADGDFKSRQSHWWTGLEHCFRKNFLMIGQPVVEKVLSERLRTPIGYGETVSAIAEDADGVVVSTSKGRTIRSRYAVGADGARSTVRNALGISFTGTKPEMVWAVLDTFLDTTFPVCSEIITFQLNGQSRVSWIPRERGMARFYVLLDGEITQAKAEASIREHMAPHRVDFVKTEWFSTFDVKERIAGTFVSRDGGGRIVLAGDAAHVHSVNGGQGLNTGIADAFALAWRLAGVLTNEGLSPDAADRLIRSYDVERRTVAQGVIDVAAALVRDTIKTAKEYVSTIEKNAGYITGMGVAYDGTGSPLVHESSHGIWTAGRRCPDVLLAPVSAVSGGEPKRLYELVSSQYGKHLVLRVGGQPGASRDPSAGVRLFNIKPQQAEEETRTTSTGAGDSPAESSSSTFTAEWAADDDNFTVVVRPDMYIGYVGQGDDGWRDYLSYLSQS
ncbi:Putative FAD-binding domain, FAD/NAD(P)-binding domain superfamily [Colletotrichum destructivum]|uniref:FAD-binding domain, FAD/NAD(P)-binding domain superfamily n=1 Tax=Colletotrichum destructivum TaxID=34406 RepID=A0AAX4IH10_9PEZI|nr:Putative FAD-binding domain, FAD/NAD(P)-binding domain superfamily [Colletotrichum destructivum]